MSPPPRELSPRARRRSWAEPGVRPWWIMGLVILLSGASLGVAQWLTWRHDERLIHDGKPLDATLIGLDLTSLKGEKTPAGRDAYLKYTVAGHEYVVQGRMLGNGQTLYVDGSPIPIRIDPDHPEDWTMRLTVPPLMQDMIGPMILVPLGACVTLIGVLSRWRVLRIWRDGVARQAVIVSWRNSPMAPASRLLRCVNATGADKRVFHVLVPGRDARMETGDTLWVVSAAGGYQPALPLAAYSDPSII